MVQIAAVVPCFSVLLSVLNLFFALLCNLKLFWNQKSHTPLTSFGEVQFVVFGYHSKFAIASVFADFVVQRCVLRGKAT